MAIRFALARRSPSPVRRVLKLRALRCAANDNDRPGGDGDTLFGTQAVAIRAALSHLREHGLSAAADARSQALAALREENTRGYAHWRAVCEMLDRHLAADLAS